MYNLKEIKVSQEVVDFVGHHTDSEYNAAGKALTTEKEFLELQAKSQDRDNNLATQLRRVVNYLELLGGPTGDLLFVASRGPIRC